MLKSLLTCIQGSGTPAAVRSMLYILNGKNFSVEDATEVPDDGSESMLDTPIGSLSAKLCPSPLQKGKTKTAADEISVNSNNSNNNSSSRSNDS